MSHASSSAAFQTSAVKPHKSAERLTVKQLEANPWLLEVPSGIGDDDWRLSPVPDALFHVEPDVSPEIRKVVDEFRQQCELVRVSARSLLDPGAQVLEDNAEVETNSSHGRTASNESAVDLETSNSTSTTISAAASSMTILSTTSLSPSLDKGKDKVSLEGPLRGIIFEETPPKTSRATKLKRLFKGKKPMRPSATSSPSNPAPTITVECASCFDDITSNDAISLACTHYYCSECFIQLIQTSMQNENFWPPRCCLQEIPRQKIIIQLPDDVLTIFGTKEREYATPAKDRWYCTRTTCGGWFEGTKIGNVTRCPHCDYEMCIFCRGERHRHPGVPCPQDKGRQLLEAEAEMEGWRQCYSCLQMVELMTGCRHITCTCKAEFCYVCGAQWRTCNCTEDDQIRRRQRLAKLKETKRKETVELEAVLEAVAAAERRERERRILEEKRQLEEMELARVRSIRSRFDALRKELQTLLDTQLIFLLESQNHEKNIAEAQTVAIVANEEALVAAIEAEVQEFTEVYKIRRGNHSAERNDAINRHKFQKRELEARLEALQESMMISKSAATKHSMSLMLEQQKELNELWDQQSREVDRMESRLAAVLSKPIWDSQRAILLERKRQAEIMVESMAKRVESDEKWVQLARGEREHLLDEEERQTVAEGENTVAAAVASLNKEKEAIEAEVSNNKSRAEADFTKEEVKHQTKIALQSAIQQQIAGESSARGRMTTRDLRSRPHFKPVSRVVVAESSSAGAARETDWAAVRAAIEQSTTRHGRSRGSVLGRQIHGRR